MTTEIKSPPVESDWLGARLKRKEDQRLVTGNGAYLADISMRGMLHAMFVLSDSAHAKILSINTAEASKLPGVVKIYTGEDIRDKIKPMPQPVVTPNLPAEYPTFWPLAVDKVKYHGEPVALVIARDRYLAEDAAELIEIEYEDLTPVLNPESALKQNSPLVHEESESNEIFGMTFTGSLTEEEQRKNEQEVEELLKKAITL